jgi:hypothetical protein
MVNPFTAAVATAVWRSQNSDISPDKIIEVRPHCSNGGTIVWEWYARDNPIQDIDSTKAHYGVVRDHPELPDVNCDSVGGSFGGLRGGRMHVDGVSYNPEPDRTVFGSPSSVNNKHHS